MHMSLCKLNLNKKHLRLAADAPPHLFHTYWPIEVKTITTRKVLNLTGTYRYIYVDSKVRLKHIIYLAYVYILSLK